MAGGQALGPRGRACGPWLVLGLTLCAWACQSYDAAVLDDRLRAATVDAYLAVIEDDFGEIADAIIAGFESGELQSAIEKNEFKGFVNATGKELGRKGKRLFMPFRIALTGRMQGPEVGDVLSLIATEGTPESAVSLDDRVAALKAESAAWAK